MRSKFALNKKNHRRTGKGLEMVLYTFLVCCASMAIILILVTKGSKK